MKKVVRLTESDLVRLVKRVILENDDQSIIKFLEPFVDSKCVTYRYTDSFLVIDVESPSYFREKGFDESDPVKIKQKLKKNNFNSIGVGQYAKKILKESIWDYNQRGPLSKFSDYDLENIRDTYKRYTSDDYYGDADTAAQFLHVVSKGNLVVLRELIKWLEENGVKISDEYKQYIIYKSKRQS